MPNIGRSVSPTMDGCYPSDPASLGELASGPFVNFAYRFDTRKGIT